MERWRVWVLWLAPLLVTASLLVILSDLSLAPNWAREVGLPVIFMSIGAIALVRRKYLEANQQNPDLK